jgi:fructokinase
MSGAPLLAGVELGGTKCICVLASGPHDIRAAVRIATRAPEETLADIESVLVQWQARERFGALGLASFGPLELDPLAADFGCLVGTPKPGWARVPLLARLRHLGVPLALDTDVNAAAFAEGQWGAARGLHSYAYVTVGTGIGVGSIVGGASVRGLGHSEAGHLRVPRLPGASWPGHCPFHGDCVEGLASGPAIEARAGRACAELAPADPVWDEAVHALAGLFHNLALTVAPERILVGGGVALGQRQLLPRVRRALGASLGDYGQGARIARQLDTFLVEPGLGARSGELGAIALAQRALR